MRAKCAYPRQGAQTRSEHIYICGFRQPDLPRALPRRPVTARVSPVSPSLNKEGNAACASLACRKVTTRETRVQRRISTWYQNLWVLKCSHRKAGADPCQRTASASAARRRSLRSRTTPHSSVMRLDRQSATRRSLTTSAGRNSRRASFVDAAPHHGLRRSSVPSLAATMRFSISTFLCGRRHMALDLLVPLHQKRLTACRPELTQLAATLPCLALMVPRGCRRSRVSLERPTVSDSEF